jgi:hypothetical protein
MVVNREYKDSFFTWLFSNPDTLRELYGALEGVTVDPAVPITINTLEGVLFKARMNDISFLIGGRVVVLIEHQSTINENMPLRLLLYIAKIYEKITGEKNILKEILKTHAAEVMNMLTTEWNWDIAREVWEEEALERGREKGREEGQSMVLELIKQGYSIEQIEARLAALKPEGPEAAGQAGLVRP